MKSHRTTSLLLLFVFLFTLLAPYNAYAAKKSNYKPHYPTSQQYFYGKYDDIEKAEKIVDAAFEEMDLDSKPTRVEKLFAIYQWITSNIHYSDGDGRLALVFNERYSGLYAALTEHVGVCSDYAAVVSYFCETANIDNVDFVQTWNHIWSIVEVDGLWYSMDCSADQDALEPYAFLWPIEYSKLEPEYRTEKFMKAHPTATESYKLSTLCPELKTSKKEMTDDFNFKVKTSCGSPNVTFTFTRPSYIRKSGVFEKCYDNFYQTFDEWMTLGTFMELFSDDYKNTNIWPTRFGNNHYGYFSYNETVTTAGCTISDDVYFCMMGSDWNYKKYQSPAVYIDYDELINRTHEWGPETVVQPTCTSGGSITKTCTNCGDVSKVKTKALGHQYESVISETPPTCSQNGSRSFHCTRCDKDITETIDKLPHTEVIDKAVNPTFAKAGKTEGSHCSVCGAIIKAQKPVAKLKPSATTLSKVTSPKSKQIKVTWKKQTKNTTGYQIQYSTSKSFKKGNKTIKVKSNKTTSTKIKKLKSKKKYYVRIRTYKSVNGKMYYSSWSKAKSVTTKK